jgi:hypothetical protein
MYVSGLDSPPSAVTSLDQDTMGVTSVPDRFDISARLDLPDEPPQSLEEGLGNIVNTRA